MCDPFGVMMVAFAFAATPVPNVICGPTLIVLLTVSPVPAALNVAGPVTVNGPPLGCSANVVRVADHVGVSTQPVPTPAARDVSVSVAGADVVG